MKTEKAIIVTLDIAKAVKFASAAGQEALNELNSHLAKGWAVKHASAMGGTGHSLVSASLVILEKSE